MPEQGTVTAGFLAERLGGELVGDAARVVCRVETLKEADRECVSWLGDVKYAAQFASSRAGVVLVPRGFEVSADRTAIRVADPDLALCEALRLLAPPVEVVPAGVDSTAVVAGDAVIEEGAAIGAHVSVGARSRIGAHAQLHPGVRIGADAVIGRDCVLWPNVVVRERCMLGDRVVVHANATIGADGYGYLQREGKHIKIPQTGIVVIEDDVEIGANSAIDRARSGVTRIGRGTKIDNLVQVGHNAEIGEHCIIIAQCGISGSTTLGPYVVLAGQVGLIDHLEIGAGAQVAAKSAAFEDLEPGRGYRGIPARDVTTYGREVLSLRRLPKLLTDFRALARRVDELESAKDD